MMRMDDKATIALYDDEITGDFERALTEARQRRPTGSVGRLVAVPSSCQRIFFRRSGREHVPLRGYLNNNPSNSKR